MARAAGRTVEHHSPSQRVDDPKAQSAAGIHRARAGFWACRHRVHGGTLCGRDGACDHHGFRPRDGRRGPPAGARSGVKNAEFRTLDAERMDLETDSVDGVLCRWGYMLMIEPATAFAETRRVLKPGGRLVFSVWAAPERNPGLSLASRVLVELGHIPPPDPEAPGAFVMADPGRIRELVVGAGFAEPEIEEVPFRWWFADQEAYWR